MHSSLTPRAITTIVAVAAASVVSSTLACMVCKVPYRSLLDRIEQSERTVVAERLDDAAQLDGAAQFRVVESIVGHTTAGTQVSVDGGAASPELGGRFPENRLLIWNSLGRYWMDEGTVSDDFLRFVGGALDRTPQLRHIESSGARDIELATKYFSYYVPFLEHCDAETADSAYTRISGAPYRVLCNLGPRFESSQLLEWLEKRAAPTDNDELYFVLLGIIGGERESRLLHQWVDARYRDKSSMDLAPMLTALIEIDGESMIRSIEQRYLNDRHRTLDEIVAAVSAMRVHGRADHSIARTRVLASYQMLVRQRPPLVELVIEDCLLWQDWTLTPEVMEIYSQRKQPWNDELLLRYLRACPLPDARRFVETLTASSL